MASNFSLISVLAVLVAGAMGFANPFAHRESRLPFLSNLTDSQLSAWQVIATNTTATIAEIEAAETAFAADNGFSTGFKERQQSITSSLQALSASVIQLVAEITDVNTNLTSILNNKNLTFEGQAEAIKQLNSAHELATQVVAVAGDQLDPQVKIVPFWGRLQVVY